MNLITTLVVVGAIITLVLLIFFIAWLGSNGFFD